MTDATPPPAPQLDMGRVVQRATQILAGQGAELAAELAMRQELDELRNARIAQLEQEAAARDAELARCRETNTRLIERLAAHEADADEGEGDAGDHKPEEGPGEG